MEDDIQGANHTKQALIFHVIGVIVSVVILTGGFLLTQQSAVKSLVQFLLPVPIVLISLRYSLWSGIAIIILTTVSICLSLGYRSGILFLSETGLASVVFAGCFHRKASAINTLSWVTLYYLVFGTVQMYMQEGMTFEVYTQNLTTDLKEQFANQNIPWQNFEVSLEAVARVLMVFLPFVFALSTSIIMYIVLRLVLKIQKIPVTPLEKFYDWQVTDHFAWIFVLSGLFYHLEYTRIIGIYMVLGIVFLYYLTGCAIIIYFLKRKDTSRFLQIMAYMLLFFQIPQIFASLGLLLTGYSESGAYLSLPPIILVTGVGLSNVWIDFRKRARQTKE